MTSDQPTKINISDLSFKEGVSVFFKIGELYDYPELPKSVSYDEEILTGTIVQDETRSGKAGISIIERPDLGILTFFDSENTEYKMDEWSEQVVQFLKPQEK
jgi:hypothetical protein